MASGLGSGVAAEEPAKNSGYKRKELASMQECVRKLLLRARQTAVVVNYSVKPVMYYYSSASVPLPMPAYHNTVNVLRVPFFFVQPQNMTHKIRSQIR